MLHARCGMQGQAHAPSMAWVSSSSGAAAAGAAFAVGFLRGAMLKWRPRCPQQLAKALTAVFGRRCGQKRSFAHLEIANPAWVCSLTIINSSDELLVSPTPIHTQARSCWCRSLSSTRCQHPDLAGTHHASTFAAVGIHTPRRPALTAPGQGLYLQA